jgi:hypothetical protein
VVRGTTGYARCDDQEVGDMTRDDLLALSVRELRALLASGHPIPEGALDDREYRGTSLGLPHFVEALTWKTFKKVFHREPSTGRLVGWNMRMKQDGLVGYEPMRRRGTPVTFGHYEVVDPEGVPEGCDRGVLIDYGRGRNGRFDPIRRLRDPLVSLHQGSGDLLLGWSYVDLGIGHLPTPSFFCLERDVPLSFTPA